MAAILKEWRVLRHPEFADDGQCRRTAFADVGSLCPAACLQGRAVEPSLSAYASTRRVSCSPGSEESVSRAIAYKNPEKRACYEFLYQTGAGAFEAQGGSAGARQHGNHNSVHLGGMRLLALSRDESREKHAGVFPKLKKAWPRPALRCACNFRTRREKLSRQSAPKLRGRKDPLLRSIQSGVRGGGNVPPGGTARKVWCAGQLGVEDRVFGMAGRIFLFNGGHNHSTIYDRGGTDPVGVYALSAKKCIISLLGVHARRSLPRHKASLNLRGSRVLLRSSRGRVLYGRIDIDGCASPAMTVPIVMKTAKMIFTFYISWFCS